MGRKRSHSSSDSSSSSSDSDSEVETKKKPVKNVSSGSDDSSSEEEEWNAKPKGKGKGKTSKKSSKVSSKNVKSKRMRKSDSDGDSDDSDSDSDSPQPKRSPAKKFDKEDGEVDFDSDSSEEFNDGFDENLMGDEEDQKKLADMTEVEREQELFNRSEKRELLRARFEIERKLKLRNKTEKKSTSKPAKVDTKKDKPKKKDVNDNDEDLDLSSIPDLPSRSTERRRQIDENRKGKDAIEILKAEREKKKLKQKLRAADVFSDSSDSDSDKDKKRRSSSSSSGSDASSDEESDSSRRRSTKRDRGRRADSEEEQEKFLMTREHLNKIKISRFRMEKWCFAPFFKDTVVGSYIRVAVGNSQNSRYIVGQIVDVCETGRTYNLGVVRTNTGLKIKYPGQPDQIYRLEFVSNQEFTEDEYKIWVENMARHRMDFIGRETYEKKLRDIQNAMNYRYSDADVNFEVQQKERFKTRPVNYAMKKAELMKEKAFADAQADHGRAYRLSKEIDRLESEAKSLEKQRTSHISAISFINKKNRMNNICEFSEESCTNAEIADDPFTRRRCAPLLFSAAKSRGNEGGKNEQDEEKKAVEEVKAVKKEETKTEVGANNLNLFNVHDFDIDLDLPLTNADSSISSGILADISGTGGGVFPKPVNPVSKVEKNRRINLDEYKKKKGLI